MLQSPFTAVKNAGVSALDVARRYSGISPIQRSGRWWACCIFHNDKTPSMLFDYRGKFHCFGCGIGGDAINFVSKLLNIPPIEAAKQICRDFNISFNENEICSVATQQVITERQVQVQTKHLQQRELVHAAYRAVCEVRRKADQYCSSMNPETAWDDSRFVEHVCLLGDCDIWLDILCSEDEAAVMLANQLAEAVKHAD